jgi:ABC-2 type transport system permease protein
MNFKRFFAVVKARNIEFFRDRSSLGWNLFFPILMLAGLSFVFSGDGKAVYKVGVIDSKTVQSSFMETRYVDFIDYQDKALATVKLEQHAIDFLVDFSQKSYWVNQGKNLFRTTQ